MAQRTSMGVQVTVFVFNSVHISSRDLALAEARSAEIFKNVSIRVIWVAGLTAQDAVGHPVGKAWFPIHGDASARASISLLTIGWACSSGSPDGSAVPRAVNTPRCSTTRF